MPYPFPPLFPHSAPHLIIIIITIIIIISELRSWKGPSRSLSPAPVREAQWGIKLPAFGSAATYLNCFLTYSVNRGRAWLSSITKLTRGFQEKLKVKPSKRKVEGWLFTSWLHKFTEKQMDNEQHPNGSFFMPIHTIYWSGCPVQIHHSQASPF